METFLEIVFYSKLQITLKELVLVRFLVYYQRIYSIIRNTPLFLQHIWVRPDFLFVFNQDSILQQIEHKIRYEKPAVVY